MFVCIALPAVASENTYFYDADGNAISTSYDYVDGAYTSANLRVYGYDRTCAFARSGSEGTPTAGTTIYSCNGACTRYSSSTYNIVEILPNGSYFEGYGPNVDGEYGDGVFACDVSGNWVMLEAVEGAYTSGCDGQYVLNEYITLRNYCGTGYHEETFGDCNDFHNGSAAEFAMDPYYYFEGGNQMFSDSQIACYYTITNADGTTTRVNQYDGCASGYKLSGTSCVYCGDLANGGYNSAAWHTSSTCTPYCDEGYGYNASDAACVTGGDGYDMYNYAGSEEYDYRDCPINAICDGNYVYCPAGSFPYYVDGDPDTEVVCRDCPGNGMTWANYTASLSDCTGVSGTGDYGYEWGQGYASTTDCLYSDYSSYDDTSCVEFMGSDTTGTYEYRDGSDWYQCTYEE